MGLLHLEGQVVVLLLLSGPQGVPPLAQDLADRPVVLVRVPLVHQSPVPFAEDHEGVHRAPDVVLFPLAGAPPLLVPLPGQGAQRLGAALPGGEGQRQLGGHDGQKRIIMVALGLAVQPGGSRRCLLLLGGTPGGGRQCGGGGRGGAVRSCCRPSPTSARFRTPNGSFRGGGLGGLLALIGRGRVSDGLVALWGLRGSVRL